MRYNVSVVITPGDGTAVSATKSNMDKADLIRWAAALGPSVLASEDFKGLPQRTSYSLELCVTNHGVGGVALEVNPPITGATKSDFVAKCQATSPNILTAMQGLP